MYVAGDSEQPLLRWPANNTSAGVSQQPSGLWPVNKVLVTFVGILNEYPYLDLGFQISSVDDQEKETKHHTSKNTLIVKIHAIVKYRASEGCKSYYT